MYFLINTICIIYFYNYLDAYDCEMELSDDEINESSEKSKNLVNINQSVSKSDI